MTKREALRQAQQTQTLIGLGFTQAQADALRRISLTLHRWAEHECNGTIQRDGDQGDGAPFWYYEARDGSHKKGSRVPDRERGALARLNAIIAERNRRAATPGSKGTALGYHVQGDPRGVALYILRPGDIAGGQDPAAYYSRGIAVY